MVYKIGRRVYNLTLKMYQVAVDLLEYINDKDLVNYINHDKFKHNKKNLSLRNRKKTEQEDHMMITRCLLGV